MCKTVYKEASMPFISIQQESFAYTTPQEMYQDNKMKRIKGLLDYQSHMIEQYMDAEASRSIAFELPTGSGKTLIGMLIGEFRRRKNRERVLYLTPTNQLVKQVVDQANNQYGLNATAFCGSQRNYDSQDKSKFLASESVGVTTYSSFFASYSFFDDVDILIMDDVHSSEEPILSNWSIDIRKGEIAFDVMRSILQECLDETSLHYLTSNSGGHAEIRWCDLLPVALAYDILPTIQKELDACLSKDETNSGNFYSFQRLKANLHACNIYLSNQRIQIRPWTAPTETFEPFRKTKQRIMMSATLGANGELERITGIKNIKRLPVVGDWDKKGLGRRFVLLPDLALSSKDHDNILLNLHSVSKRSVVLTPTDKEAGRVADLFRSNMPNTSIFTASDIIDSKNSFTSSSDAVIALANRFDGIDFPDDECRMLFIVDLPKVVNLQENFLVSCMNASILYEERIRTRIIQALGRCTRNGSDFSAVCIMGTSILKDLTSETRIASLNPELRAELEYGVRNSKEYSSIAEMSSDLAAFLNRDKSWEIAEDGIVTLRDSFKEKEDAAANQIKDIMLGAAKNEVDYLYALWKGDFESAFSLASNIADALNAPSLAGYRCYWNVCAGNMASILAKQGIDGYQSSGIDRYKKAAQNNSNLRWLPLLPHRVFGDQSADISEDFFCDTIEAIEEIMTNCSSTTKYAQLIEGIKLELASIDGKVFEAGHEKLGTVLGFTSKNSSENGAPDPYWIVNPKLCLVAEDKIYSEDTDGNVEKSIPLDDVRQAIPHANWIRKNEKELLPEAEIVTVFVSNSQLLEASASHATGGLFYLNRESFKKWAAKALDCLVDAYPNFIEKGDAIWRQNLHQAMNTEGVLPIDYINMIRSSPLSALVKTN